MSDPGDGERFHVDIDALAFRLAIGLSNRVLRSPQATERHVQSWWTDPGYAHLREVYRDEAQVLLDWLNQHKQDDPSP